MSCNHTDAEVIQKGKKQVCVKCWESGFNAAKEFHSEYGTFDVMEALGIRRADEV